MLSCLATWQTRQLRSPRKSTPYLSPLSFMISLAFSNKVAQIRTGIATPGDSSSWPVSLRPRHTRRGIVPHQANSSSNRAVRQGSYGNGPRRAGPKRRRCGNWQTRRIEILPGGSSLCSRMALPIPIVLMIYDGEARRW